MEFSRPILLWGLALTLVPIWIHFFGIRPRKTKVIPSLIFLNSLNPSQRSKSRLKDLIVLILRVLTIAFVVFAVAGPYGGLTSKVVQIDNYPARWTEKQAWLAPMIDGLDQGNYKLYDREGNFYGQFEKESLWSICASMPYSALPFQQVDEALTLSYGYADDVKSPALLPTRETLSNKALSIRRNSLGDYQIQWLGLHEVTLMDSNEVLDISVDSTYTVTAKELSKASTLSLKVELDDVAEDNTITWAKTPSLPRLLLHADQAIDLGSFLSARDSVLTYSSNLSIDYSLFEAVVLIGFKFFPEQLKEYQGRIIEFQQAAKQKNRALTQPSLNHPFFSNYFIGPSLQNKWPVCDGYTTIEIGMPLLSVNDDAVATIDGTHYRQGFTPVSWEHPYYNAIKQWSLNSRTSEDYIPFLGQDAYPQLSSLDGVTLLNASNRGSLQAKRLSFHSEKIYLLLALVCALIALIFVKI